MNALTTMPRERALTEQQQRFVAELVASGCTGTEAARKAGFAAPGQEAYRLMRKGHVLAAIREEQTRLIGGSLTSIALKTLSDIMTDTGAPASARVSACRVVVEMGGLLDTGAGDAGKDVPLHEMTEAQLMRFMERAQAVVDAGGDAPVIEAVAVVQH
jgi:hypothetical protein